MCLIIGNHKRDLIVIDREVLLDDSDCAAMERTALEEDSTLAEALRDKRLDPEFISDATLLAVAPPVFAGGPRGKGNRGPR